MANSCGTADRWDWLPTGVVRGRYSCLPPAEINDIFDWHLGLCTLAEPAESLLRFTSTAK